MIEYSNKIVKCLTETDSTLINSKIIKGYYYAKKDVEIQFNLKNIETVRFVQFMLVLGIIFYQIMMDGFCLSSLIAKYEKKDI